MFMDHLPAYEKSARLQTDFKIKIDFKSWLPQELDDLYDGLTLLANIMDVKHLIGDVSIVRKELGKNLGLAYKDRIEFNSQAPVGVWSLIHELAHVWDAKHNWNLSVMLETYTEGFTDPKNPILRSLTSAEWDAGLLGAESKPGRYGRKPGVNQYGYFYGDKPSGSNWNFNRVEDFAESLVMYCGWGRDNILSRTAHGRIERYLLPNGSRDPIYGIMDNWTDYAQYFYPEDGDYTKTKRWRFIDDLVNHKTQMEK